MQIIKNKRLSYYISAWSNSGRVAWYYPRKNVVALNGAPTISVEAAIIKIKDCLKINN
jgi:hypothetical protein